jgi:glycerol kinase
MDVLKAMEADSEMEIKELRVDGGATSNNLLMQFQSNLLNCKVIRPNVVETTALGAAYLAGLAVGYWKNVEEIQQLWKSEKEFTPEADLKSIKQGIKGWKKAIHAAQSWTDEQPES